MAFKIIDSSKQPEGLDPRVRAMLEGRPEEWFEDMFGFGRARQVCRNQPGYQSAEAFDASEKTMITWDWLDDIGLIDRTGQERPESEKQSGLLVLEDHLDNLARFLGELGSPDQPLQPSISASAK